MGVSRSRMSVTICVERQLVFDIIQVGELTNNFEFGSQVSNLVEMQNFAYLRISQTEADMCSAVQIMQNSAEPVLTGCDGQSGACQKGGKRPDYLR